MGQGKTRVRKQKWNGQQDQYLKFLREEKKIKSWKTISRQMATKFPSNLKSSKQCRENYRNYARFYQGSNPPNVNNPWTPEEDKMLAKLYAEMGSSWSNFTNSIPNKSQNCIKNRFYNLLKKLSKSLDVHRTQHKQILRGASCYDSMIRILEFSSQVKNLQDISENLENMKEILFESREQILKCCFHNVQQEEISCSQYCSLIRAIKDVNKRIKCFGICKAKNRKLWKLPKANFKSDQPHIKQQEVKIQAESDSENSEEPQKQDIKSNRMKQNQVPRQQQATSSQPPCAPYGYFIFANSDQMMPMSMPYFPMPMFSLPEFQSQPGWQNVVKTEALQQSQVFTPLVIIVKKQEN